MGIPRRKSERIYPMRQILTEHGLIDNPEYYDFTATWGKPARIYPMRQILTEHGLIDNPEYYDFTADWDPPIGKRRGRGSKPRSPVPPRQGTALTHKTEEPDRIAGYITLKIYFVVKYE